MVKKKNNDPIVPPRSPADIVLREEGIYSVFPFTYDLYEWTDGSWPIGGSFDSCKLQELKETITSGPDPKWDFHYTQNCLDAWIRTEKRHPIPKQAKQDLTPEIVSNIFKIMMQINPDWTEVYRTALLNITATSNAEHVDKLMTEIELTAAEVDAIKTAQNNIKDKTALATLCVWSQLQLVRDLNRCYYCEKIGRRERYCRKKHSNEAKPSAPSMEPVRAPHTMKNPLQRPGEYNH